MKFKLSKKVLKRPYPSIPDHLMHTSIHGLDNNILNHFNTYRWVNHSDQCGAYAAAMMISVLENRDTLDALKRLLKGSSSAFQVKRAITKVSKKPVKITLTRSLMKQCIDEGKPVCLLLQTIIKSGYGNHWVCAYQYVEKDKELWFKVYDNWSGNQHSGWVKASWVLEGVYFV